MEKAVIGMSVARSALYEFLALVKFDEQGLVPVIAQQHDSGEVLMMAWMNRDALEQTLQTGRVCYWSRSRQALWRKGDTSGQTQTLVDLRLDCDRDALLALVDQVGVACHTGRHNCFYRAIRGDAVVSLVEPEVSSADLYGK